MENKSPFLTTKQFAEYIGMHYMTIHRHLIAGKIPGAFKVGGRYRISVEVFEREKFNDKKSEV